MKTKNPDVIVNNIEFASGQEPENSYEFATLVRANYTIQGPTLARMLGKQQRVLEKFLYSIGRKNGPTRKQIISKLTEEPHWQDRLAPQSLIMNKIRLFVGQYVVEEFDTDAPHIAVYPDAESDLPYELIVDSQKLSVTLETEYTAAGD